MTARQHLRGKELSLKVVDVVIGWHIKALFVFRCAFSMWWTTPVRPWRVRRPVYVQVRTAVQDSSTVAAG